MPDLTLLLRLTGLSQLVLASTHLYFARRFNWREEARRMMRLNEQIFHVHTFFICLILVMMGLLSSMAPEALLQPSLLGRWVDSGLALFWLARLVCQWFVYDSELWRGKTPETVVHVIFTFTWCFYNSTHECPIARLVDPAPRGRHRLVLSRNLA
jgi:hypothetical protein